jgi:hypothetical protein
MRSGLIVSGVAHAALIAWGIFSLPSATPLDASNIEQIPVDFVELGDITQINKGVKTAALVEEVAVPPPAGPCARSAAAAATDACATSAARPGTGADATGAARAGASTARACAPG